MPRYTNIMMTVSDIFDGLYRFKGKAYEIHKQGLPEDVGGQIAQLCEIFESSTDAERRGIVSNVVREVSFLFIRFGTDMAVTAVRQGDGRAVIRGLEALAIENCTADWRDSTIVVAVLYHSAQKIGLDADEALRFAASLAVSETGDKLFGSFLRRTPENRALSVFWIKEGTTANGEFTYTSSRLAQTPLCDVCDPEAE